MATKKHIRQFGKQFDYLIDPELRKKEIGSQLQVIENAGFYDIQFETEWSNTNFVNCQFVGGYQISLDRLVNCRFIDCEFEGIIGWGEQLNVQFLRCKTYGVSNIIGNRRSKNVVHDECEFIGKGDDKNHYGFIGNYGEVTFNKCKGSWYAVIGGKKLTLNNCNFMGLQISTDSFANSGSKFEKSDVVLNQCRLFGLTDMITADFASFTMLDTAYESIDLTEATFTGDFHMEQCQGGNTKIIVKGGAQNFTIKNCRMQSNGKEKFRFFVGCSAQNAVIDGLKIVNTNEEAEMQLGAKGGKEIINGVEKIYPPRLVKKITIANTNIGRFNFEYSAANYFLIKNCEFDSANFRKSRYNKLEIINTRISRQIDLPTPKWMNKTSNSLLASKIVLS
ncbi:hypothetical protein [Sapientia aquatica]|uniref:Right-handed parallel beta-helix repeat-containing protein n=1 Tax=Sapientia aquatica TaxID=1549640 RepID=A0A4R5VTI2_9BURK|nr:hypothetical protein [Sapientia aquatica]TDK61291.1 hypothetical protein E2I14_17060 [Sapientia aquatica]